MNRVLPVFVLFATSQAVNAQLQISGVLDGPLPGGLPKAIELYASENIADLGVYALGSANNGGGSDGEEFVLSGSAVAGQFLYVATEGTGFETFLGFVPDFTSDAASINGDDALELFRNGTVVDTFGEVDVDGSGRPWEYTDGWSYRMTDSNGDSPAFVLEDWLFSGPDALDGVATNSAAGMPFPSCTYAAGTFEITGCSNSTNPPDDSPDTGGESELLITGIIDGPLSGGLPKAIELIALADVADLSVYGLGSANNGGGTDGEEFVLSGSATAGQFLYVSSEDSGFEAFLGFAPDFTSNAVSINGDDAVELFRDGVPVDTFGEIDVDGSGQPWEHTDGWAYRRGDSSASPGFAIDQWFFSGPDALDGETTNAAAASAFPACSYELPGIETSGCVSDTLPPSDSLCAATDPTPIFALQGARHVSPLLAGTLSDATFYESVPSTSTPDDYIVHGVVTAVDSNGFYLQDPVGDGDIATSDAVFVFTVSSPAVAVGDTIAASGPVQEFFPGGSATRNLSTTQVRAVEVEICSSGHPLPAPVILGTSGRTPPLRDIDPDALTVFDPVNDGLDFFESLEAMRVTIEDATAIGPTNRFGEIFVLANQGVESISSGLSMRGTLNIAPDDFNPERIQIDEDSGILSLAFPEVSVGARLGDVTGVVGYGFGNFEVYPTDDFTDTVIPSALSGQRSELQASESALSIASYNVLNLDPRSDDGDDDVGDGRFRSLASHITNNLNAPDIIGLQEVQDNSGSEDDGTVSASETLQTLVDEIAAAGGPGYRFIDNTFIADGRSGGQPGGNIRTAFLYNPERVVTLGAPQPVGSQDPGSAFFDGRLPLAASFFFNGATITVVNNHFSSKGGSAPIFGFAQDFAARQEDPSVNGSLDERRAQSAAIQSFVAGMLADHEEAAVVVLGDLNEFEFVSPVTGLESSGLTNLTGLLSDDERYSFIFQGNSQSLDHILVSEHLLPGARFEVVHVNVEFPESPERASDHDPLLATLVVEAAAVGPEDLLALVNASIANGGLEGVANNPRTRIQKENDFRKYIDRIQFWNARGREDNECRWVELTLKRIDGEKSPADIVVGSSANIVANALRTYSDEKCPGAGS